LSGANEAAAFDDGGEDAHPGEKPAIEDHRRSVRFRQQ
jgi:hypothetical protein